MTAYRQGNKPNNLALWVTLNFISFIGKIHQYAQFPPWDIFVHILKWLIFAKMAEFLGIPYLTNGLFYSLGNKLIRTGIPNFLLVFHTLYASKVNRNGCTKIFAKNG